MGADLLLIEENAHFIDMESHLSFLPKPFRERLPEAILQYLDKLAGRVALVHVSMAHGLLLIGGKAEVF
jgi:hypothetical protein